MYLGVPNPNILVPLEKMTISAEIDGKKETIEVLYNPESYSQSREVRYAQSQGIATNTPLVQYTCGGSEILQFKLFFDSMSAGSEVGGGTVQKLSFAGNSLLPSLTKAIDVRTYTNKVYRLMEIDADKHVPPLLKLKWSSLQFTGHLISCSVQFVRFSEQGMPLRAWMDCTFQEYIAPDKVGVTRPLESPDTTNTGRCTRGTPCGPCPPRSTDSRSSGGPSRTPTACPTRGSSARGSGWFCRP